MTDNESSSIVSLHKNFEELENLNNQIKELEKEYEKSVP